MKIAAIGDLHLHENSPRFKHTLEVLDFVAADARGQGSLAAVFLGDLWEDTPSGVEILEFITRMKQMGQTFVVLGNHEAKDSTCWMEIAGAAAKVADDEFAVCGLGPAVLLLVPYPRRGHAPFDGLEDDGTIQSSMRSAAGRVQDVIKMAIENHPGRQVIVCVHGTPAGSTTRDTTFEMHKATEVIFPLEIFEGVALVLFAHIHKAQELVTPGGVPVVGVGSLIRQDFAEADDPKSYVMVDIPDDGSPLVWERRPVPAREMIVRTVTEDTALAEIIEIEKLAVGREVKIVVELPADKAGAFDRSQFDRIRLCAAHFQLDTRTTSIERAARAPDLTNVVTLQEQTLTYLRAIEASIVTDGPRLERLLIKVGELSS